MGRFENDLVHAFNDFFSAAAVSGVAYRIKQHKYTDQFCDVLVDSPDPQYYLAIENKSIRRSNRKKLYFSQHFSSANGEHQVERITDFLHRSGRTGFLALEVRYGRGKPRRAFLIPWEIVREKYENEEVGITIEEVEAHEETWELGRNAHKYVLPKVFT